MKKTVILNNDTDQKTDLASGNTLLGSYLESKGSGQEIYGQFNDYTGDASTDLVQIGGGRQDDDRYNALRVTEDGEVVLGGGGEVYMISPDTGEVIPVYMTGDNNRLKKVYMSK